MKRLFALILLLSVCSSFGAIKYYDDYPQNANPPTNFIISLQTKDKSAGGIPYNYWELWQMSDWLAANGLAGQGSNVSFTIITNNILFSTNTYITTNFTDVSYTTNLFVDNFYATNFYTTNFNANYITNITLYSSNIYATNITVENITNNTFVGGTIITTNIFVDIVTNNSFYTTNITIDVPGGFTNNNLTPLTVMFVDINRAESSIPTATGLLTNNGTGGVGWSTSLSLDELDVNNGYITNFFTGKTNYNLLGTDGNGFLTLGSGAVTNITITNAFIQFLTNQILYSTNIFVSNLYADTNFTTNLYFNQGKGNTMIVTNVAIYGTQTNFNVAASSAVITKADQVLTNAVNAHGVFTNTATGPPSFGLLQNPELQNSSITIQGAAVSLGGSTLAAGSSPSFNAVNMTNFSYMLSTNTGGGSALVVGGLGTPALLYTTNITAATTLAAFTITTAASAGGIKLYCTCSGGTDRILTFPNGCVGAGLGTPPAVTITNAKAAWFDVILVPGVVTNVFWSPVF